MLRVSTFVIAGLLLSPGLFAAESPRQVTSLDFDWRFHRGDIGAAGAAEITAWRWKADNRGEANAAEMAAVDLKTDGADWRDSKPGQDVFRGRRGFAWFRTVLPNADLPKPLIAFDSVDDNATVYLNGTLVGRHEGWSDAFEISLEKAWRKGGPNVLAVLVENTDGAGGVGPARLQAAEDETPKADSPIGAAYDDSSWQRVDVPHDYVVEGTFDQKANKDHGFLPVDVGWYRKVISIPAEAKGRRLWLEFDGIYRNSRIWLNGKLLGKHPSGYTSFRFDITDVAQPGKDNLLAARVDPRSFEGWWYEGGGIYRHVRLISVDPVHIAPWGVFVTSTVPDVGDGNQADATVNISAALANQSANAADAVVRSEILDPAGNVIAKSENPAQIAAGGTSLAEQKIALPKANLWSDVRPYLYQLRSTLLVGGKAVDQVVTNFGVRTIRFDADKGFLLNGKPVKLKGTCNHQDHAGVGIAMPDRLLYWRIEKLKEMGSNAYRCSHNPVASELLDACDKLGMLVMDENRHLGDAQSAKSSASTAATDLSELDSLVLRDRNHPSVVMWSICNEEGIQGTPAGGRIGRAMKERILKFDNTRPITAAMNGGHGGAGGLSFVLDIEGFNYSPGAYAGYHRQHPNQPIVASETASEVGTRGIYATQRWDRYIGDRQRGYVSAWGLNAPPWAQTAEAAWKPVAEQDFVAGCFVWTGFDYKGEPTPFGWPCINSHFGIMDICGFPKDSYWYYQSWWTDRPVLHIFPHWNWSGREGQDIDVWCYSNCERVELILNGASLGAKDMPRNGHLQWKVKYTPGTLLAKGTRDGKEITAKVETTGAPAAIVLEPDRTSLSADGTDLSMVAVRIVDDQGRLVATADNEVTFSIEGAGKILGVGNGDPSSHEPDKASKRHAFNGLCMAIVQTKKSAGEIKLTASAPGLKDATSPLLAK